MNNRTPDFLKVLGSEMMHRLMPANAAGDMSYQDETIIDHTGKIVENKVKKSIDVSEGMTGYPNGSAAASVCEHQSLDLTENGAVQTNYMTKESQPMPPGFDSLTLEPMPPHL